MDGTESRTTAAPPPGRWLVLGVLTLVAMLMAALALDDITTDNAMQFRLEYRMLALAALWLQFIAWRLFRGGSRMNAGITMMSVGAAAWMAIGGIGHKRDGGWAVFWPQYLALTWAWIHGIVVGILMIRRGLRPTGSSA